MSSAKRRSESQCDVVASSDRLHTEVVLEYLSSEHPAGISLADLKDSKIPYPMSGYPNF